MACHTRASPADVEFVHAAMSTSTPERTAFSPDLRTALIAMIRKRVPESEVEDIVQATLTEAIESPHAPKDSESLRRWIFGVAKNKVVDFHRRRGRESFDLPEVAEDPAPHAEADLLRWAERNLPEGEEAHKTLGWMLREGDGEKLESIAASEKLPAPRVRQRVSRLRRHLKTSWAREVGLLAALGVVVAVALVVWFRKEPIEKDNPVARGEEIRRGALVKCDAQQWDACVSGLDDAKKLDPAGDGRPEVQKAREAATKALAPAPVESNVTPPPAPMPTLDPIDSKGEPKGPIQRKFDGKPEPTTAPVPTPVPTGSFFPTPSKVPSKESTFTPPAKPGGGVTSDFDPSTESIGSGGGKVAPATKKGGGGTKGGSK